MLKKEDLDIISRLRRDGRMKVTKIAKEIENIPLSTIYEKIKNNGNLFTKFTGLINFEKLGFFARAYFVTKLTRKDKDNFRTFLEKKYFVNNFWKINNGYDFMFEVVFRDMNQVENFRDLIEHKFKIKEIHMFYIIKPIRVESFLVDENDLSLVEEGF